VSLADLVERISRLESLVRKMIRMGAVSAIKRDPPRVRVTFADKLVSDWLPVMVQASETARDYWVPAVDEQVTCVFLPIAPEVGFVLGSFHSDQDAIPEGADAEGERVIEADARLRVLVGEMEVQITPELFRVGGEGATEPYVLGNKSKTLLESLIDWMAAHTHPTGVGPSGPPATAADVTAKKTEIPGTLSEIIKGR
jgi:hypothetical protein